MNTEGDIIRIRVENGIEKIILNKPKKKNAITKKMYIDMANILNDLSKDESVHMVVLTGTGDFFTSGNDFSDLFNMDKDSTSSLMEQLTSFKNFIDAIITFPKLLVALVNGPGIGVGTTMLGLFDMVYASDKAYFYTPFSKLGLVAEGCSTYTFPKIMGPNKASNMLYFSYKMDVKEAKECGLVSEIYKDVEEVWTYLRRLNQLSIESIMATKRLVQKWNKETLLKVNKIEVEELINRCGSADLAERLSHFILNKSKL
ncbi:hypothetical protein KPH14_004987 [Odynerus spinipes]|uniref:Enoyl-CoA delta isomerase 2, mitochondrial n=1 Tax=Odynerus spinipes TaxID=1348599 RepID=A0AAD9RN14_9HYME|nr:hypothetical protein KPH14_004987 [Odynerus spinipes]